MTSTSERAGTTIGPDARIPKAAWTAQPNAKYPGIPTVINGNGAVAYVMGHVCGGVIGYPITPSTEISELFEAYRAGGGCNVWGHHPFFFNPEGEHSAQSGALGAALTGGKYISNASSSQGILYGLESHYVTVGKKVGGFVLHVAARVVSRHSLNVMAGHDDVYALLGSGYTVLFGANAQEAADLAAIAYKVAALSLIPVANAMDGFATSHMLSEALLPEPALLRTFLGDPAGRIPAPTVAQEILFGAKGRIFELRAFAARHRADIPPADAAALHAYLDDVAEQIEHDNDGQLVAQTLGWIPAELHGAWRRQWLHAAEKGTRLRVPAVVDPHNPGMTGGVQNQADFQAGSVDHRTHFAGDVPRFVREAMAEYADLTGRVYEPVHTFMTDDADDVVVGLGSVTDDAEAVAAYLRTQGKRVGVVGITLLQPFPEAELVQALRGKRAVTVLERCDQPMLTTLVTQALFKARENAAGVRHAGIPSIDVLPRLTTAIFGLGAHDLQPRHLVAAFANMENEQSAPFVYLGSQFFSKTASPRLEALQERLRAAYPHTEYMALPTEPNPHLLPPGAFRLRFHSVGGYGTIATGKLLTDILAGVLGLHSKAAPKYGSEKSGAPTNYYITLSPEPIKITNAELEDVEIVISPDHKVFSHTNPLRGLADGGTFILQSARPPQAVWRELPAHARQTIRDKRIRLFIIDAFGVAKKHAPTEDLQTRMMGIAFIGAVCGHVDRVVADASEDAVLAKIRQQITKKFGAKGGTIVESNMEVIREGLEATQRVDYDDPAFDVSTMSENGTTPSVAISAGMCRAGGSSRDSGLFDLRYYEDTVADRFRDASISEAPVLPGVGLFMPPGYAAWKDKGLFRRNVPEFVAERCTGCMECTLVCPDAAIPNTVHEIGELLSTAVDGLDVADAQRKLLRGHLAVLSNAVREQYRRNKDAGTFAQLVATAVGELEIDNPVLRRSFAQLVDALAAYPVARTRPFFDAMEQSVPGSGGLYAVAIDPWKCTGCLECIDVCGPGALVERQQDAAVLETLQQRFAFTSKLPNTPTRFTEGSLKPDGETKRLLLDRDNYYAMTGGHGACRGCGEVSAIRLVVAANRALHERRRKDHVRELEDLIAHLRAKSEHVGVDEHDPDRPQRIRQTLATLEKRLYGFEGGPTGQGPAPAVIANATGCSSVFASTFPFNPYRDPWVNSLFQDTPALAKGLFEGICAGAVEDFRALRIAKLELADGYVPAVHDPFFRYFRWAQFSSDEFELLPTLISMGGDGATYDIGFGALSRLLTTDTPIKVVVLNSGAYSNTGGQASTASYTAQDADLTRFGTTHRGKQEDRKELGLIAAFHPKVFVAQTSTAMQGHFMRSLMAFLRYDDSPALFDVYTPCQPEHGIADSASNRNARLAVLSRMNPLFVHDPRRGEALHEWFSLDGNPDVDRDWTMQTLSYVDDDGSSKLFEVALTPADFALQEGRFKRHFSPADPSAALVPIVDYLDLSEGDRSGKTPFIYTTDDDMRLIKLSVSPTIVELVEDRRKSWRMLQYLAGTDMNALDARHHAELAHWRTRYDTSVSEREASIDAIAQAMSELAASSNAPGVLDLTTLLGSTWNGSKPAAAAAPAASATATVAAPTAGAALVAIDERDMPRCTNCKTCYQDLSELFERTTIVVDGASKDVARVIPGKLETLAVTPELVARARRAAANCDAEIIRCSS